MNPSDSARKQTFTDYLNKVKPQLLDCAKHLLADHHVTLTASAQGIVIKRGSTSCVRQLFGLTLKNTYGDDHLRLLIAFCSLMQWVQFVDKKNDVNMKPFQIILLQWQSFFRKEGENQQHTMNYINLYGIEKVININKPLRLRDRFPWIDQFESLATDQVCFTTKHGIRLHGETLFRHHKTVNTPNQENQRINNQYYRITRFPNKDGTSTNRYRKITP